MKESGGIEGRDRARQRSGGDVRRTTKDKEERQGGQAGDGASQKALLRGRAGEPCSAGDLPPPPHLADEGELTSPDVVTIQPEGEDGG